MSPYLQIFTDQTTSFALLTPIVIAGLIAKPLIQFPNQWQVSERPIPLLANLVYSNTNHRHDQLLFFYKPDYLSLRPPSRNLEPPPTIGFAPLSLRLPVIVNRHLPSPPPKKLRLIILQNLPIHAIIASLELLKQIKQINIIKNHTA